MQNSGLVALRLVQPLAVGGLLALRGGIQRAAAPLAAAMLQGGSNKAAWTFGFHSAAAARAEEAKPAAGAEQAAAGSSNEEQQPEAETKVEMTLEECTAALTECQEALEGEKKKAEEMKDKALRTMADMENLRDRTARTMAEAKQFAVQGLVKNLLEVADILELAAGSVPPKDVSDESDIDRDRALKLLRSLREGVLMTDTVLLKVLAKEGVVRYDPLGDPFDPNLHDALFEVPDATKEPGTVAVVVKRGYMLNERVVRAAEVGVTRAVEQ